VLLEQLRRLVSSAQTLQPGEDIWETPVPGPKLRVTFIPMDVGSRRLWVLQLQETPYIPAVWRTKLTKRELQVASRVLLGWDNQLIADDLVCSVDTVKKHLQHIFDKLGVNSRAQMQHQATQL